MDPTFGIATALGGLVLRVWGFLRTRQVQDDTRQLQAERVAWPSGEFGSIPIEGGVSAAFRKDIESSEDPEARMLELEAELQVLRNVFLTAEAGGVEEIIDPVETRRYLQRFVELAYRALEQDLGKKSRVGFRP